MHTLTHTHLTANIDFDATSQNVTFDPNSSEVCLSIRIFQDGMPGESREVFSVQFNLPPDVPALVKGAQAIANVFVTDIPGTRNHISACTFIKYQSVPPPSQISTYPDRWRHDKYLQINQFVFNHVYLVIRTNL